MAALFIKVEVDPAVARDAAMVKKLVEVCPVNIFAEADEGLLAIVERTSTSARSASSACRRRRRARCGCRSSTAARP
jgi:hypothetical protein